MQTTLARLTVEDRLEITQLISEYGFHEDTGAADEWAALFTTDGRFVGKNKPPVIGHEALAAYARKRWDDKPEAHQRAHWVANIIIRATEDGAEAKSYQMSIDKVADGYEIQSVSGKVDQLRRENGRWRFHVRTVGAIAAG